MMCEALKVQNLPADCLLRVQTFLIGEPHRLRLNHSNKLKEIQNKYRIDYSEASVGWSHYDNALMSYLITSKNLNPHMINTPKNVKRIMNFIHTYQYGLDVDDDEFNADDCNEEEVYMVQCRPTPPHPPCGWVMVPPPPVVVGLWYSSSSSSSNNNNNSSS